MSNEPVSSIDYLQRRGYRDAATDISPIENEAVACIFDIVCDTLTKAAPGLSAPIVTGIARAVKMKLHRRLCEIREEPAK